MKIKQKQTNKNMALLLQKPQPFLAIHYLLQLMTKNILIMKRDLLLLIVQ